MKFIPFTLLLCASAVMAANVVTQCTGISKNHCPAGFRREYYGRTMNSSTCSCVRPETAAETEKRKKQERSASCRQAKNICLRYTSNTDRRDNPCDSVLYFCERDDINQFCDTLKRTKTRWQCGDAKQLTFEEAEQKICNNLKDQCLLSGSYYRNSDPKSETCEDYVSTCPRAPVLAFCRLQRKRRCAWSCEESKAFDDRFNHDSFQTISDNDEETKRRVCTNAHDQCYKMGRYYPNSDPHSESCEDLVRTCFAATVNVFCSDGQSSKRVKWRCANSKAYKARKDLNPFDFRTSTRKQ